MEPPRRGGRISGMKRMLVVPLLAGLALAPAAVAKGPHAILTTGPEGIEVGRPWESTIELNELRGDTPRPSFVAIRRDGHVDADMRRVPASMRGALGFKATMIFPAEGRWRLLVIAGPRRFRFPAVDVGSGRAPQDYVSFAVGSYAAREGAGGVYMAPEPVDTTGDGVLPPETLILADDSRSAPGDGIAGWWLLPVVGVVLAGAGVATLRRRR
jgi:hypothetical protein